jgi:hypothetical protein
MNVKLIFNHLVEILSWARESFDLGNLIIFSVSKVGVGFLLPFLLVDL